MPSSSPRSHILARVLLVLGGLLIWAATVLAMGLSGWCAVDCPSASELKLFAAAGFAYGGAGLVMGTLAWRALARRRARGAMALFGLAVLPLAVAIVVTTAQHARNPLGTLQTTMVLGAGYAIAGLLLATSPDA